MRRKELEVTKLPQIAAIIDQCKTCHIAMVENEKPYLVPLSFGYELKDKQLILYFHSAKSGRKIDILKKNNQVCFEMCLEGKANFDPNSPCASGYYYSSVHGFGEITFVEDAAEKAMALSSIMKQQMNAVLSFTKEQANTVCVFKLVTGQFTGKKKTKPQL